MHFIIYSGGMDSFTLLHSLVLNHGANKVQAITFDYNQRHRREIDFAQAECARLGIKQYLVESAAIGITGQSALTSPTAVPHGHYEAPNMKKTVVPGRNTIMLATAMGIAEGWSSENKDRWAWVYYGAHAGDHQIYPDCRPVYFTQMRELFHVATDGRVGLSAPFLRDNKARILRVGEASGLTAADYARTWTCYEGGEHACGKCGSCVERAEAFMALGWDDPALAHIK